MCDRVGIQNLFFGGNTSTAFTPQMFEYGNEIKQPVPLGESPSSFQARLVNVGPDFKALLQYVLPENDFYIRGGDCNGIFNKTAAESLLPNAATIESYGHTNTGHAFPLHKNATAGYEVTFDLLKRNGL